MSFKCLVRAAFVAAALTAVALPAFAAGEIQIYTITDSATFTPGVPYIGSLATVFCKGLTGINGVQLASGNELPYELAGITVRIFGNFAPVLAVADLGTYQQINVQVQVVAPNYGPYVEVQQGASSGVFSLTSIPVGQPWGVFFNFSSGYAAAQHADYSPIGPDRPAHPGEVIVIYGTNPDQWAAILHPIPVGVPARADPLSTIEPSSSVHSAPYISVNDTPAEMFFSGLTPGLEGVFQMNFRVPPGTPDGDARINAVTDTVCINQGAPNGYCIYGKKSIATKIPVRAAVP